MNTVIKNSLILIWINIVVSLLFTAQATPLYSSWFQFGIDVFIYSMFPVVLFGFIYLLSGFVCVSLGKKVWAQSFLIAGASVLVLRFFICGGVVFHLR